MIRAATPHDLPAIQALGVEALNIDPYPELVPNKHRVYLYARECISAGAHFAWVSENAAGEVKGYLCALVTQNHFYDRNQATVIGWYCKETGDGIRLMQEFLRWARGRRGIKVIQYTGEKNMDPRIGRVLQRLGLNIQLPTFIEVRS